MTGTVLRRYWQMLLAAGILATLAAIVHATIPDGTGVIHACYANDSGSLRVVDNPTTCKNNEAPLAWSFTGPQGVQGPQGSSGAARRPRPSGAGRRRPGLLHVGLAPKHSRRSHSGACGEPQRTSSR